MALMNSHRLDSSGIFCGCVQVGFPLEICATALLRYAALAEAMSGPDSAHAWAARVAAWLLLLACTLAAVVILAHFACAFGRSLVQLRAQVPSATGAHAKTGAPEAPSGVHVVLN